MQRRKFTAFAMGIAVVATMLFAASPASAASGRMFNAGPGMNGYCLATQEPYTFAFSRCLSEKYVDQSWDQVSWGAKGYQIRSLYREGCLASHGERVFTNPSPCNTDWADQMWRPYDGQWGMWENMYHRGRCLAAHSNGNVFLTPCNKNYSDQYWYLGN